MHAPRSEGFVTEMFEKRASGAHGFDLFQPLGIWNDFQLVSLINIYFEIDHDNSGRVDAAEFLAFLNVAATPYALWIFQFDHDTGTDTPGLQFPEWVALVVTLALAEQKDLAEFLFGMYKDPETNRCTADGLDQLILHSVAMSKGAEHLAMFRKKVAAAAKEDYLSPLDDASLSLEQFQNLCHENSAILWSSFIMKDEVLDGVIGKRFWQDVRRGYRRQWNADTNDKNPARLGNMVAARAKLLQQCHDRRLERQSLLAGDHEEVVQKQPEPVIKKKAPKRPRTPRSLRKERPPLDPSKLVGVLREGDKIQVQRHTTRPCLSAWGNVSPGDVGTLEKVTVVPLLEHSAWRAVARFETNPQWNCTLGELKRWTVARGNPR